MLTDPASTGPASTDAAAGPTEPAGPSIGVVAATAAGRRLARILVEAWPHARMVEEESVAEGLRRGWRECEAIVAFVATGVVVRVLGPLTSDKHEEPAVVVVDDAARHAVALLGGHAPGLPGGANALAERVGLVLDADPVITTATDVAGLPGLDTLGWPVEGAVASVTRALLDGLPVQLEADAIWPLPAFPPTVLTAVEPDPTKTDISDKSVNSASPEEDRVVIRCCNTTPNHHSISSVPEKYPQGYLDSGDPPPPRPRLLVTDRVVPLDGHTAVLRPPSLVVGVGASRGVSTGEVTELIARVLREAGLSPASVRHLATVEAKADEPGVVGAAAALRVPLRIYSAGELAAISVPHPSEVVRAAVGTPSVAEAAASMETARLPDPRPAGSGGARLLVPKTASAMATVAVARLAPRGRLSVIGLGPGARDLLTPRAIAELRRAGVVVGLDQYVDQVRDLLRPGARVLASGLGQEQERALAAVEEARTGRAVALLGSGDAGIYAMASPALAEADESIDVVGVPGVTAGLAAAALLGAPLGHDHAYLSLSDLHTPWPIIEDRVRAVAVADLVVLFYNPRSRGRDWQLPRAMALLSEHRPPSTPVGVVRNASRPDESVLHTTLADFDPGTVDMVSLVIVGSSRTRSVGGRMVTPRGYRWSEDPPSRSGPG